MKLFFIKTQDVIKLCQEKAEFERGVMDLFARLVMGFNGKSNTAIKNEHKLINEAYRMIEDLFEENDKLRKQTDESAHLSPFEHYKYHTLCARATLYPGKTIEEVTAIVDSRKEAFES